MNTKTNNIVQWILAGMLGFVFIGSGISKLLASEETVNMAKSIGLSVNQFKILGIVELLSALLFLFTRTGIVGTLLLAAYMGGAIATHLTHGQSPLAPIVLESFIWMVALFRFPELRSRLLNTL
jgi:uncharacterized membrane protein YphA (DoxX/SURF4 family)